MVCFYQNIKDDDQDQHAQNLQISGHLTSGMVASTSRSSVAQEKIKDKPANFAEIMATVFQSIKEAW